MNWMEFQKQVWPLKDRLYRVALRLVNDPAEAEDVVQEVMVKLWQQGKALLKINNLEAWSLRLTRNHSLDKLKGGYRKRKTQLGHHAEQLTTTQQPDTVLEQNEALQNIHQLIQALPEKHRLVIQLRDVEGMSYEEVASSLNMTMPQVKTNLFRARTALRKSLQKNASNG